MNIENKIESCANTYSQMYDYMFNLFYQFKSLEKINNLNYLYKTRLILIENLLNYLKDFKARVFLDNISCGDSIINMKLYIPPGRLFSYFSEITLFENMSRHFEKLQIEIDKNNNNLNFQKTLKIYGRHGYKKSITEIKKYLNDLLKSFYLLLIDLKSYSDNKPIYTDGRNKRNNS